MAFNQYTPNAADPLFNIYNKYGSFDEYRKSADFRPEEATGLEYRYSTTGKGAAPVGGWKSDFVSDYGITNKGTLNYNTNYQNQWGNLPTAENVRQIQATSPAATGTLGATPPPIIDAGGGEAVVNRPPIMDGSGGEPAVHNPNYGAMAPPPANFGNGANASSPAYSPNMFAALANSLINQYQTRFTGNAQASTGATAPTYNPYAFSAPSTSQPDLASGLINTAQGSRDRYANMLQAYAARGLRNPFRMA